MRVLKCVMSSHSVDPDHRAEHELVLIHRIVDKDRDAFKELYTDYYPRLNRFLGKLLGWGDESLREELLNDTLLTVWQKAVDFRGESRVSSWIFGIAYFKGIKALNRSALVSDPLPELVDEDRPDFAMNRETLRRMVLSSLQCLPPEQRMVVELTYYNGCSYQEISEIMAIPVNTVKTRMFHARLKLRGLLACFEMSLHLDEG